MSELFQEAAKKKTRKVPFAFVLDLLDGADPILKPMFGCLAIYVGGKIVLILRDKEDYTADNGIWLATTVEHHKSLRADFPSLRSIKMFCGVTGWQNLPVSAVDFEASATRICELILEGDFRIGKIPKPRSRSKKKAKTKRSAKKR